MYAARFAFTLALTLAVWDGPAAATQAPLFTPPQGSRVEISNGNTGRYAGMYGKPEFRGLDDRDSRPWPTKTAIRTVGRFEEIPGRGGRNGAATDGIPLEWDSQYARYRICGTEMMICLALVPVQELQGVLEGPAQIWIHRQVEVIGAIDTLDVPGIDPRTAPIVFQIWSISEAPDLPKPKIEGAAGSSLEPLVRYPKGAEGRVVTVSGTFRGSNLFEDLPPESRRSADDWVLKDGPFSIWVSGRAPKGKGWSLDPRSHSDCTWRIEATGKVENVGGILYLRPSQLLLRSRVKTESE